MKNSPGLGCVEFGSLQYIVYSLHYKVKFLNDEKMI